MQSRKKFPKEGKTVATAKGEEKVVSNDIFNERVTLRSVEGETRVIALAAFRAELNGGSLPEAVADLPASAEEPELAEIDEILPDTGTYAATIAARAALTASPPVDTDDAAHADAADEPEPQAAAAPKKRRRGRRGGRRGRGKGSGGSGSAPPEAPAE